MRHEPRAVVEIFYFLIYRYTPFSASFSSFFKKIYLFHFVFLRLVPVVRDLSTFHV